MILLLIYKSYVLPYPPLSLSPEICGIFFMLFIQYIRLTEGKNDISYMLFQGSIGNKTESSIYIAHFIILMAPMILGYVYFGVLQVYVFIYDIVLAIFGLFFILVQIILGLNEYIKIKIYENGVKEDKERYLINSLVGN